MTMLLVRHGETPFNATRVMQLPNTPLSPRGMEQARRVARRLAAHPVRAILSSRYARARMTAEAIQATTGAPITLAPDLHERHFGALRGRRFDELDFDPFAPDYAPPGGESVADFDARVRRGWEHAEAFARDVEGDTVVVSHGLFCRVLTGSVVPIDDAVDPAAARWGNTCVTEIDGPPWRITRLACAAHLDDDGVPDRGQPPGL